MSAKAQSLPVAIRPHVRTWHIVAAMIVLALAATLSLTWGRGAGSAPTRPIPAGGPPPSTARVSTGLFQNHPLP